MACHVSRPGTKPVCLIHGGQWTQDGCATERVLQEVKEERARQYARYGTNDSLKDGTGPDAAWLRPLSGLEAKLVEHWFRKEYGSHERRTGQPTWMHLVREEIAEAFQEEDSGRLCEELIQVAALCVSWVETKRAQQKEEGR